MIDMTGKQVGWLTVLRLSDKRICDQAAWICECKCGKETVVPGGNLRRGLSKSCGCGKAEFCKKAFTTHGDTVGGKPEPEWRVYHEMKQRCYNPKSQRFHTHGARGIKVCERWRDSFQAFLGDMGRRPSARHSLDRIDNDGDYEPSNCRWATIKEQARNRRTNNLVTVNGVTRCIQEWAEVTGINPATIYMRVRKGMSIEEAVATPSKRK